MKRRTGNRFIIPLFALAAIILAQTAGAQMMSNSSSDMAITAAVQQKLRSDIGFDSSYITVETKNGEVTLKGAVESEHDVNRAAKLAHYVEGVKNVDNRLTTEKAQHYKAKAPPPGCQIGANWEC